MLALTPQHRLLLAVDAVDFRRGIDDLAAICIQRLKEKLDSGTVFVFTNKRRITEKILVYDDKSIGVGAFIGLPIFKKWAQFTSDTKIYL